MGIEDFRVAPDNKGGRPTKEEQEEEETRGRIAYGDPALPSKDKEDWEDALDTLGIDTIEENLYDGDTIGSDEIGELSNYAHLFPWNTRVLLELHGIYETNWFNTPEDYPPSKMLSYLLTERGVENDFTEKVTVTESGEEITGGLAGLINDAKRKD